MVCLIPPCPPSLSVLPSFASRDRISQQDPLLEKSILKSPNFFLGLFLLLVLFKTVIIQYSEIVFISLCLISVV